MKNYTDDEKRALLKYLGELYRKECKSIVKEEIREDELHYGDSLAKDINQILTCLSSEQAEIIKNDFLVIQDGSWWKKKYSPLHYLRLKNIAVDEFFRCLYA